MFNRILVPLDGSPLAERAIPHAEKFARIFGSSIILLQVLDPTTYHDNNNPIDPLRWQIRKTEADMYMNEIARRVRVDLGEDPPETEKANFVSAQDGHVKASRVEYSILEGKTAENIVNFTHAENIDLLVISTHGSGGLSRWNISSVTHKVINLIYVSVLIIRAYNFPETEDEQIQYRRILLPIDSSRRAEISLSAGLALASGERIDAMTLEVEKGSSQPAPPAAAISHTKLVLAAVIKPPELPIPEPYPAEVEQISQKLIRVSHDAVINYLDEMKGRLDVECETCVVENNSVNTAIHDLACQDDVDLVVLCAHGYTGLSTWPYGSITLNYMEHGIKPVLVIQDVHRSQVQPTAAAIAAEKSGER